MSLATPCTSRWTTGCYVRLLLLFPLLLLMPYLPEENPVEVWCKVHVRSQRKPSNIAPQVRIRLVRNLRYGAAQCAHANRAEPIVGRLSGSYLTNKCKKKTIAFSSRIVIFVTNRDISLEHLFFVVREKYGVVSFDFSRWIGPQLCMLSRDTSC